MIDDKWIKELSNSIFDLVQTHSGGIKLTELVANLDLSRKYCDSDVRVQAILDAVEAHPKLAILVYGWDMGDGDGDASGKDNTGGLIREKIFVYTPFPTSPDSLIDVGGLLNDSDNPKGVARK